MDSNWVYRWAFVKFNLELGIVFTMSMYFYCNCPNNVLNAEKLLSVY